MRQTSTKNHFETLRDAYWFSGLVVVHERICPFPELFTCVSPLQSTLPGRNKAWKAYLKRMKPPCWNYAEFENLLYLSWPIDTVTSRRFVPHL